MAIEIVDLPMKNGDFPVRYVSLPEGTILQKKWGWSWSRNWESPWKHMNTNHFLCLNRSFHTSQLVNDHCLNENYHKIWGIWHVYQFLRGFSRCFFGAQDLMIRMSCNFGILVLDVHNLTFRIFLIVFHHFCWYLVDLIWSSSVFHHFSCYFHLFSMYFIMVCPS